MNRILTISALATLLTASTGGAIASDARAIALGGSVVANGKGVHGAVANPASMMAMQRRSETIHIRFGFAAEFRDPSETIDTLSDSENKDLIEDVESEIDDLSATNVECNPFTDDDSAVCIAGTQGLSDISGRIVDIMNLVDGQTIDGLGAADLGMAFTHTKIPFAINLRVSAAGSGTVSIADDDLTYISEFNELLDDDGLTLGELSNSEFLTVDEFGVPLSVVQPEDVLESEGSGGALLRTQLGVSLATSVTVGGLNVDLGVTPKFSSLLARSLDANIRDEFLDNTRDASDRFDDSEVTASSVTLDVGGSMMLPNAPIQVAAVIRNLIPESIKTNEGFEFETTPQLILGGSFQRGMVNVTGDLALNEAKQDNFATQKMGIGVEFGTRLLALRAGISHDAARKADATSLSLGFGLGALELGGRLTGVEALEVGAQLAFSFQ